MHRINIC